MVRPSTSYQLEQLRYYYQITSHLIVNRTFGLFAILQIIDLLEIVLLGYLCRFGTLSSSSRSALGGSFIGVLVVLFIVLLVVGALFIVIF